MLPGVQLTVAEELVILVTFTKLTGAHPVVVKVMVSPPTLSLPLLPQRATLHFFQRFHPSSILIALSSDAIKYSASCTVLYGANDTRSMPVTP